jgi:hypothetical protein
LQCLAGAFIILLPGIFIFTHLYFSNMVVQANYFQSNTWIHEMVTYNGSHLIAVLKLAPQTHISERDATPISTTTPIKTNRSARSRVKAALKLVKENVPLSP